LLEQEHQRVLLARQLLRIHQRELRMAQQDRARQLDIARQELERQQALELENQYNTDNVNLADLRTTLPLLRTRSQNTFVRTAALIHILTGSGAVELIQLQTNSNSLTQISLRCQTNLLGVNTRLDVIRRCPINQIEHVTRTNLAALQPVIAAYQLDFTEVVNGEIYVTATEVTYQTARDHIRRYPNLGLTLALINDPLGPIVKLSPTERDTLNSKLAGYPVTVWVSARMPRTRTRRTGEWMLVPYTLSGFGYHPSAEVFHDWIWQEKTGHGQSAATMRAMLANITTGMVLGRPYTWSNTTGNWVITHQNVVLNIILSADRTVLITYYKT
jgi:hypothetical protein